MAPLITDSRQRHLASIELNWITLNCNQLGWSEELRSPAAGAICKWAAAILIAATNQRPARRPVTSFSWIELNWMKFGNAACCLMNNNWIWNVFKWNAHAARLVNILTTSRDPRRDPASPRRPRDTSIISKTDNSFRAGAGPSVKP